jgi:hypothetical protein
MNDKELAELKRIKSILSAVTGLEDDDQEYIEDARKALQSIISQDALDWMANNARELGLDYEPAPVQEPYGYWWIPDGSVSGLKPAMSPNTGPHPNFTVIPLYTTPPAAQPAPVQEPRARLMTYIGKGPYPKPGYTVARTYEECPENQYPDAWEEGEKLYTTPPTAQPAVHEGRDWSLLAATQESLREHMAEIKRLKAAQPVKTYSGGKPWPVAPAPDPAPIIQQLVTALEGSGTRMRSDHWYVEIEAVAAGKFYLNSKGEGL